MTDDNSTGALGSRLVAALQLAEEPVALTFSNARPDGDSPAAPVPAGCSFWETGAKTRVVTKASDHQLCAIGVHTHNLADAAPSHSTELTTALGAMTGLGYVTEAEVGGIPVMQESFNYVTYAPLAAAEGVPGVVLVRANAAQSLTLTEAIARVDGNPPAALGRPACALVPQVANTAQAAASLGCCGARAYMDSLAEGVMLWGLPGERLADYVDAVETLANAANVLTAFHAGRRKAVEAGAAPTVQESLDALS